MCIHCDVMWDAAGKLLDELSGGSHGPATPVKPAAMGEEPQLVMVLVRVVGDQLLFEPVYAPTPAGREALRAAYPA